MSLWCLMAAPLFYSGDLEKLDAFTLNVLCNREVIEVNQDSLGHCARPILLTDEVFLMVKPMADGSIALGIFNSGEFTEDVFVPWSKLQIEGARRVRDLWRHMDLGIFHGGFRVAVPRRGGWMTRLFETE